MTDPTPDPSGACAASTSALERWALIAIAAVLAVAAMALATELLRTIAGDWSRWWQAMWVARTAFALAWLIAMASALLAIRLVVARPNEPGVLWLAVLVAASALHAGVAGDGNNIERWTWPASLAGALFGEPPLPALAPLDAWLRAPRSLGWAAVLFTIGVSLLLFSIRFPRRMPGETLRRPALRTIARALFALAPADAPASAAPVPARSELLFWIAGSALVGFSVAAGTLPPAAGLLCALAGTGLAAMVLRHSAGNALTWSGRWLLATGVGISIVWVWRLATGSGEALSSLLWIAVTGVGVAQALGMRAAIGVTPWTVAGLGAFAFAMPLLERIAGGDAPLLQADGYLPWFAACVGVSTVNLVQTYLEGDEASRARVRMILLGILGATSLFVVHVVARGYNTGRCDASTGAGPWACALTFPLQILTQELTVASLTIGAALAVLARGEVDPRLRWTRATTLTVAAGSMFVVFVLIESVIERLLGSYLPDWSPGAIATVVAAGVINVLKHPFEQALARVTQATEATGDRDDSDAGRRDRLLARVAFGAMALLAVLYAREVVGEADVESISDVVARTQRSVYLLVVKEGGSERPLATAWVYSPTTLATNAHVAESVREALDSGGRQSVVARRSHGDFDDIPITAAILHPAYRPFRRDWVRLQPSLRNASGALSPIGFAPAYDVAILTVADEVTLDDPLPIADPATVDALGPQAPLVYVGFPSEGVLEQNLHRPVPVSQTGVVSAFETATRTRVATAKDGIVLVHSIPATGGASGGPIIDGQGRVLALMNAINTIVQGTGARAPNAVQINYAQRVDLLPQIASVDDRALAALRRSWQTDLASAFVVLPDAAEAFLAAQVDSELDLDGADSVRQARVYTEELRVPPKADDGSGGETASTLTFRDAGTYLLTALDTARDVDLIVEIERDGAWSEAGRDLGASSIAAVRVQIDGATRLRARVRDGDDRPRTDAPAGAVRLDVYQQP